MVNLGEVFNFLDRIKMGETVLVEYSSSNYAMDFTVLLLKRYAEERGYPFVIYDNLDTLYIIDKHLGFFGLKDAFSNSIVIKTGGVINIGRVIERIALEREPAIYLKRYEDSTKRLQDKYRGSITVVLGMERLFAFINDFFSFYEIMTSMERFLGSAARRAFYLCDTRVCNILPLNPLPELENIASTVIRAKIREGRIIGKICKSPKAEMMGWKVEAPITELL
ncbi:DUF257 family protein [Thermococcus sp.]